jgi:hypothetical protein
MLLLVSPLTLLLSRTVRAHYAVVAAGVGGAVVGSLCTVVAFRRSLSPGARRSARLGAIYGTGLIAVALVLLTGSTFRTTPVGQGRPVASTSSTGDPMTSPTTASASPTTSSPTTPVAAPTAFVAPPQLGSIAFTKEDVQQATGESIVDETTGRGDELFDPAGFDLCSGLSITTPTVIDSHPIRFNMLGDSYFNGYWGSEPVLYDSVEGTSAVMRAIRNGATSCGFVVRPGAALGDETVRLGRTVNGAYRDYVFFRWRNIFVQLGSLTNDGNHTTQIDELAARCSRVMRRVVGAK